MHNILIIFPELFRFRSGLGDFNKNLRKSLTDSSRYVWYLCSLKNA
jgi:hypothetical protein